MTTSPQSEERRTVDDRNQQSADENPVDLKNSQEDPAEEVNHNDEENRETVVETNDCDVNVVQDDRQDDAENDHTQNNINENQINNIECQQSQNQPQETQIDNNECQQTQIQQLENQMNNSECHQTENQNVNNNQSGDKDNETNQDDKQAKDSQNQNNENHNRNHPGKSPRANRKISKEEKNDKDWLQPPPQFTAITEDKPPMDFDDLLPYVGEFGLYQKILFLMMIPFLWCVAFVYFGQIFFTMVPELHWCKVEALKSLPQEIRRNLSIPIDEEGGFEKCRVYAPPTGWEDVLKQNRTMPDPTWPIKPCDEGWEYDRSEIPYDTISTELDWVCSNAALPSISQSVFFVGAILGGLIFGWMADRFGRIPALVWSNIAGLIGGIMTAFAQNFWQFTVCRFIVGLAFDNCFTMMYILVLEYVGPQWRTFVANMSIALFFTLASCVLPWMAIYIADWRWLAIITSLPLAVAIITPCTVPESARWLVSQGKMDRAIGILKKFEKINGKDIDPKIFQEYQASVEKERNSEDGNKTYSVLDLFKTPRLRKITILLILIWMAISLVFDGHVRNVGSLGLDVFLTFTIASATELPADTFLTLVLDRWGRRWLACGTMVISGVFSLLATTVPQGIPSASLAIVGRFCVNISYNIGLQYAAELLPTVVRAQGVALIHIMGYVATIISPFIVYLATVDTALPLYVLGALGILGGALALYLPETMDQDLPQTLADGEEFGKDQTMWDIPCVKKKPPPPPVSSFSKRASIRASVRGEQYRSNLINRRLSKISNKDNNLI